MNGNTISIERKTIDGQGFSVPCALLAPPAPAGGAVIVHGYGGCKEEQLGLAWRIAEAGLAACAIDLRGHGEHLLPLDEHMLQDAEAAIAYCRRYGKVASVGHSLGGRLALLSSADYSIAISPAFSQTYHPRTEETLKDIRSYRVREAFPGEIFDVLRKMPVWQSGNGKRALVIYGSRDVTDIVNSCVELKSKGVAVAEIDKAVHSDIYLNEETFEAVARQLSAWFKA